VASWPANVRRIYRRPGCQVRSDFYHCCLLWDFLRRHSRTLVDVPVSRILTGIHLISANNMSYVKSHRRRTYARRTTRHRRKISSWGRRRTRKFGSVSLRLKRLPRRQARKRYIRNVASKKKWDTMRSAGSVIAGNLDTQITLTNATTIFLFCPNYRFLSRSWSNDHTRNAQDIFFRGFKEKFWVLTRNVPLIHRRVVFWAQIVPTRARATVVPNAQADAPPTYYRNFTEIQDDSDLMNYLFQGEAGLEYENLYWLSAKLDRRRTLVISDTTKKFNPGNETGMQKLYSTWIGINRRLSYPDEESGSAEFSDPWVAPSPWSKGNLFVMDMFSQGFDPPSAGDEATFCTQSTVYWHEA